MAEEKKVVKPKNPAEKLQEFLDKEGIVLVPKPIFAPTNHDSFELVVRIEIVTKNLK